MLIDRIDRAVILLGRVPLTSLVGAILAAAPDPAPDPGLDLGALVEHQIAVAHAAAVVARGARLPLEEEARTAGLIHDIGLDLAVQKRPDALARALAASDATKTRLVEHERLVSGTDHCEEAEHVLGAWGFPDSLVCAVGYHHDPLAAPRSHRYLAMLVYAGECLARRAGFDDFGDEPPVLEEKILSELRLSLDLLDAHVPTMLNDLARAGIQPRLPSVLEGPR